MSRSALVLSAALVLAVPVHAAVPSPRAAMSAIERARDERLVARVAASFDTTRGGFVDKRGYPSESAVLLALANGQAGLGEEWDAHARLTLGWMRGLADSNLGGFGDHAVNPDAGAELVDRSTVTNARRLELLIAAWRTRGNPVDRADAARTVEFVERILLDPRGGFVVSQIGDREPLPEPNGCMIRAWLEWAAVTADPRRRDFALRSIDRVWDEDWKEDFGLLRVGQFDTSHLRPEAVDQAEMGRALVLAARLGGRPVDRERAVRLGEILLARFEDTERGGFRAQAVPARDGKTKKAPRESSDNARVVWFLEELTRLTGDLRYRAAADRAIATFDDSFDRLGLDAAEWALATRVRWVDDLPESPAWRAIANDAAREPAHSRTYRTSRR